MVINFLTYLRLKLDGAYKAIERFIVASQIHFFLTCCLRDFYDIVDSPPVSKTYERPQQHR
jgi:hypothetical protein